MAVRSNFKNMTLCLMVIGLVCSALLAFVNQLTQEPIAAAQEKKTLDALKKVMPDFEQVSESEIEYEGQNYHCYKALSDTTVVGYAVVSSAMGFGGPLELMVGFDAQGVVWNTSVLAMNETPGLGAKCTETDFQSQFEKFDPAVRTLAVTKDGGEIDAITASTITSRAYVQAVSNAYKLIQHIKGGQCHE